MKLKLPLSSNHKLVRWANRIRGYYGFPVYLVGSQLTDKENPRDVDIVCIISDEDFERRFGNVQDWINEGGTGKWTSVRWEWSDDCIKTWRDGCDRTGLNIDFKVYPQKFHDITYKGKKEYPMLKLDTRKDFI